MDSEQYRRISDDFPQPVAVLSTKMGRYDLVSVIDSFVDVSYDPPTMAVSLYADSRASEAMHETRTCALSVLADDQRALAETLSEPGAPLQGMLHTIAHERDLHANALILGAVSHFSLEVTHIHQAATHELFVCAVRDAHAGRGRSPLVRFSKRYRYLR